MSESNEDIYITQNRFSGIVFPTSEVDEIMQWDSFLIKTDAKKQVEKKDNEQTSFTRGVVVMNDAKVLARK